MNQTQTQTPSPYVNPLAHTSGIFDSSPIKMDTSMVSNMGGGGGGVYHGFDGNRAGYDLSAYQGAYVPQHPGNHAMQRLDPYSQTEQQTQQQQGGRRRIRRTVQKKSLKRKNKNKRKYKHNPTKRR
jgi:hypothetical protein